jgi:tight adherence protein C
VLSVAVVAFLVAALGLGAGTWLLLPQDVDARLSGTSVGTGRRVNAVGAVLTRFDDPLGRWLEGRMGPGRVAKVEQRLIAAGVLGRQAVHDHLGRRATYLAAATAFGVIALLAGNFLVLPLAVTAVWLLGEGALNGAVRRRSNRIETELPDFLDVVAVMLSAGLGFREALRRVADAMPGPVAEEIDYVLRQLDLGVPRREAFTDLRGRNRSEAFDSFVAALLQAEELGSPLSDAMIALAEDIRRAAAQSARRRAAQTAPRVSLVLTLVIVPASLALLVSGLVFGSEIDFGEIFQP